LQAVYAKSDIEAQVSRLFMPTTISRMSCEQIEQYPRYIRAIEVRLGKTAYAGLKRQAVARRNTVFCRARIRL
jgi:hypothetical protein